MQNIVTPVKVAELRKLLQECEYDKGKTEFLVRGFSEGFSLEYNGPRNIQQKSPNLKLQDSNHKVILWNKVMKEVKLKRYTGPFKGAPPFKHFIQSPIGLVPKDGGRDMRLIFHLSYPRNLERSVNYNTPRDKCCVTYPDFCKAVELCQKAGKCCKMSKSDMKSAFRILCVRPQDWMILVMMVESPIDGQIYYFVNKCLPFGASISCFHFQAFSDAISHVMRTKTGKDNANYLDDFLFVALLQAMCNGQLDLFLNICSRINFPVSLEKTLRACTQIAFLGFLIDSVRQLVLLPVDKINKACKLVQDALTKKKVTLKKLQEICGFLNFIGRCILPGRTFTRRLYSYTSSQDGKLKLFHHIRINSEMREDLKMWNLFINDHSIYARSFIDFSRCWMATEICMFSDASRAENLGFGGICNTSWMYSAWPTGFIAEKQPSIEYLELYALVATVCNWVHRYANKRIILFCDNQSVVHMVNKTSSSCKNCMVLIRILVLKCLTENVRVFAKYIRSKDNYASDLLSRLKISKFLEIGGWDEYQTAVPKNMWPIEKIWKDT